MLTSKDLPKLMSKAKLIGVELLQKSKLMQIWEFVLILHIFSPFSAIFSFSIFLSLILKIQLNLF